jgi:nucleotide-binding universal stress UspA family protein
VAGPRDEKLPVVLLADDGQPASDVAWAWLTGHRLAKVVRLRGSSRRELVEVVRADQIERVVMGTRGLTGWTQMRVGSTASALLKDESANLLIGHVRDTGRDGAG